MQIPTTETENMTDQQATHQLTLLVIALFAFVNTSVANETLRLDDYDLTQGSQVDRLHKDIVSAAADECKGAYATWVYKWQKRQIAACVKDTVDHFLVKVGNSALSQLHASIDASKRYGEWEYVAVHEADVE
jgi:hypothetical protein